MVLATGQRIHQRTKEFFQLVRIELEDAIEIKVRYYIEDERGETRKERNEIAEVFTPPLIINDYAQYLWEWFHDLSSSVSRVQDGICKLIASSEYLAWAELSGNIVLDDEYAILRAMDRVYCREMNAEFEAYRARQRERQEAERKAKANGGNRGRSV